MEKRIALLTLALIVVGVWSSIAIALPPMGPPRATLQEGQWAFGLEYGHSEMDLKTFGTVKEYDYIHVGGGIYTLSNTASDYTKYKIQNLASNMFLARLGVGTWENWDFFVRFGATDAQDEITEIQPNGSIGDQHKDFDGGSGFAWGVGTRATFYQEADTTWGGLLQITWANPDKSDVTIENDSTYSGEAEIDYWEVQIAIGPTVESDYFRIYGGPFLHFVNGDLDINGKSVNPPGIYDLIIQKTSHDIKEESQFGGYAGAQIYLDESSSLFSEFLFTDDAWGAGVGITWKF